MDVVRARQILIFAREEIGEFAPGWHDQRFLNRIWDIFRFVHFNRDVIALKRRRSIARLAAEVLGVAGEKEGDFHELLREMAQIGRWRARELQKEIQGLGGLKGDFRRNLLDLAAGRTGPDSKGHGGDRRSAERSLKESVLVLALRLYREATKRKPGFSIGGPMVRFVNLIGELVLDQAKPFTSEAVRMADRRTQGFAQRLQGRSLLK